MKEFIAQGIGFAALALSLASYQCKSSRRLFRVQLLGNFLYLTHFLLLGAYSASVSLLISCIRNLILVGKGPLSAWKGWLWIIVAANVGATVLVWENWFSILPCIGVVTFTLGCWTRNGKKLRIANLFFSTPAWLIYDLYTRSYSAIINECLTIASTVISVCRFGWKALDTVESSEREGEASL